MAAKTIKRETIEVIKKDYIKKTNELSRELNTDANKILGGLPSSVIKLLKLSFAHVILDDLLTDPRTFKESSL